MKLVVVKKGAKKWVATKNVSTPGCCLTIEGAFFPCFEIGLNG